MHASASPGHHRVAVLLLPEIPAGVDPTRLMPDRPVARRDIGFVGAIAVAHQGAGIVTEERGRMPVRPGGGEGEHRLAPVAEYRPEIALLHAPGLPRVPPGPDRRLVHLDDGALQHRTPLCLVDRLQERDRPVGPLAQRSPADGDAGGGQHPVLAVERQMPEELVDEQPGDERDICAGILEYAFAGRGAHQGAGLADLDLDVVIADDDMIYTGVTRGKRLVVLVGQRKAVAMAVRNASVRRRWLKLHGWLSGKAVDGSLPIARPGDGGT